VFVLREENMNDEDDNEWETMHDSLGIKYVSLLNAVKEFLDSRDSDRWGYEDEPKELSELRDIFSEQDMF